MNKPGDEYKIRVIKNAVKNLGDYEKFVKLEMIEFENTRGCTYKISDKLSQDISEKIKDAIEKEAARLNIRVAQI